MNPSFGPSRRAILTGALAVPAFSVSRPKGPIVDTHVHLFADDQQRFPFHANAPYKPAPVTVEDYAAFAIAVGIDHAVIVHPEPYQDDHHYLEYCFAHEPSPVFFKGTCLFDPVSPQTPGRMEALVQLNPGRIVALRIHEVAARGTPAATGGALTNRDMRSPEMKTTWRKVQGLGLSIQMHFVPYFAPQIGDLAAQFPDVPVILDHLGRAGQGTSSEYEGVLKLAKLPRVYMKYSGINYSSKEEYPFTDAKPLVRRAYDAFGPDRMLWGTLGANSETFDKQLRLFDMMFDFAAEGDRVKIRGANAIRLFDW